MSKVAIVLVVLFCFVAGFGGGWVYSLTLGKDKDATTSTTTTVTTGTTATTQTLAECLTAAWGADKYAAITANPNLATDEDNLASLKCYK